MTSLRRITTAGLACGALAALGAGCGDDDQASAGAEADGTKTATTLPAHRTIQLDGRRSTLEPTLYTTSTSRDPVAIEPIAPARSDAGAIVLPVDGGQVDAVTGAGSIEHEGGFRITGGRKAVVVKDVFVDTRTGDVFGLLNGSRTKVLRMDLADLDPVRQDGRLVTGEIDLRLAEPMARTLNEAFGVKTFRGGTPFGDIQTRLEV